MTLTVRGPNPQYFFAVLRDGLELTLARFPGLTLKRTVPCPVQLDDGKPCPHEFDFAHLKTRLSRTPPKNMIECPSCLNDVSVISLLFGLHPTTDGQVLARLDEATEEIVMKLDKASDERAMILDELSDLRELTQRQFLTLFNAEQRLAESHCPRVFSLRPSRRKKWLAVDKVLGTKWQLQLYCEAPGCWHPAVAGKQKGQYTIPEPAKWLNTIAPWAKRLITVFKYTAHFANPVLGYSAAALAKLLKDDVDLMKALLDKLPDVTADRDLKAEYTLEESDKTRGAGGASLRSLRHLLTELDPQQDWGGLVKTLTPEGHWLWLCDEHAEFYLR